jgi:predicted porin
MKKTLVAIAALTAVSAFAQSSVTLSGRASMDVGTFQATGATAGAAADFKSRTRVADSGSRIIIGVNEDLGGGMHAAVYCETGINIDNGSSAGQAGTVNANTSEFCSREGRAFFGNNTAEIRLGRQNVWWTQGALNPTGSALIGSDSLTNMFNGGVGVYGVRLENQIKVVANGGTGAFAGSEIYMGYMGASGAAALPTVHTGEAAGAGADAKGKYSGLKLNYAMGPMVFMLDQQSSENPAVTSGSQFKRDATKIGAGYKYTPTSMVSIQTWNKKRTDQTNAAAAYSSSAGNAKDSGYGINVNHDLSGGWMAHAQYSKAGLIKGTTTGDVANSGATAYSLGATKSLSKRTHLYGSYHMIKNQSAATYQMNGGSYQSGTPAAGADTKIMSLGMIHNF